MSVLMSYPAPHPQEKCHQYWPAERSARYQYFVVDPMAEYNMPQYILREFKVTDARVSASAGSPAPLPLMPLPCPAARWFMDGPLPAPPAPGSSSLSLPTRSFLSLLRKEALADVGSPQVARRRFLQVLAPREPAAGASLPAGRLCPPPRCMLSLGAHCMSCHRGQPGPCSCARAAGPEPSRGTRGPGGGCVMEMWRGGGGSCRTRVLCAPSTPTLTSPSPFFLPFLSLFSHQLLARVTSTGSPPSTSATVRSGCCVPVPVSPPAGDRRVQGLGGRWGRRQGLGAGLWWAAPASPLGSRGGSLGDRCGFGPRPCFKGWSKGWQGHQG